MAILIFILGITVDIFKGDIVVGGTSTSMIESATGNDNLGDSYVWKNTYKLAQGDSLIIRAGVIRGDDISECGISRWEGNPILTYAGRTSVEMAHSCQKTEYLTVWFKNSALLNSKTYHVEIMRIPASDSLIDFDTKFEMKTVYDTVWREVDIYDTLCDTSIIWLVQEGTQYNLHSKIGQATGRGTTHGSLTFILPLNSTGEISYWLGTENKPKSLVDGSTGKAVTSIAAVVDPVVGLLTGGITSVLSATATTYGIDYTFSYLKAVSLKDSSAVNSCQDSLSADSLSADTVTADTLRADTLPADTCLPDTSGHYILIAEADNIGGEARKIEVPAGSSCKLEFKNNSSIRGGPVFVRVATRCFATRVMTRGVLVPEVQERSAPK